MNAILGFSEILLSRVKDPKIIKPLKTISSSGNSLLRLINDILDLSKIEAGKFDIQYSQVNLKTVFQDITNIFQHKLQERRLDFILDIQKDIPESLLMDGTRLRQVLTNLVGNSVKFTDEGYIKLAVNYKYSNSNKGLLNLKIRVEDSGIGIPVKDQKTIFEAFTQVAGQKNEQFGGTGLGLSITKRLIEAMNGTINLESEVGKGSTFNIELKNVEILSPGAVTKEAADFIQDSIKFKPAKIVIADDIEYNRDLIKLFFDNSDFEIFEAENGADAVEQVRKHKPDILLLDLKMPVMNGYEAAKIIRADENLKKIKIVVLTASAMKEDEPAIRKIGDSYLKKPVTKSSIIQEFMKYLPYETVGLVESKKITDEKLVAQINTDVLPLIDELIKKQSIRKLEDLAQICLKLSTSFKNDILTDFSKQVSAALECYNLDELEKLVSNFKEMI